MDRTSRHKPETVPTDRNVATDSCPDYPPGSRARAGYMLHVMRAVPIFKPSTDANFVVLDMTHEANVLKTNDRVEHFTVRLPCLCLL